MSLLEVSGLTAGYGDVRVLHGIDLSVEEGEIAVVLGANGAGKSTLLRAISRMIPSQGVVQFAGHSIERRSIEWVARNGMAHVPEGRGTFGELTVEENLRAGGYWSGRERLAGAIREWYEFFPRLRERAGQLASSLSGGEQQMLAIARAMISGPRLLLLDEPSLGLAPKITQEVFSGLMRSAEQRNTTVLMVEQNAALALDVASVAFVIAGGQVALRGTAAQMRANEEVRRAYLGRRRESGR